MAEVMSPLPPSAHQERSRREVEVRELWVGGIVYEIRCIFCKHIHRSEFFDEVEDGILECRDRAEEWRKGRLATWHDPMLLPKEVVPSEPRTSHV